MLSRPKNLVYLLLKMELFVFSPDYYVTTGVAGGNTGGPAGNRRLISSQSSGP